MTNLTERKIKALKAPAEGYKYLWDVSVCGFGVRITCRGVISLVLRYVINGRQRVLTLGRYPIISVENGRKKSIRLLGQVLDGRDPIDERQKRFEIPTVREFADHYLNDYAKTNKRPSSILNDENNLKLRIIPAWGHLKINTVQKRDILTMHSSMSHVPTTANRQLALLSKFFNLAIDEGYRADNPVRGIKRYPEQIRERWLSNEEISRLAAVLRTEQNQVGSLAILFLLATGARKGEALNATWDQFRLEEKLWIKPAACTKQKKCHILQLNDYAINILRTLKANNPSPYVFYYPREKGHPKDLSTFWRSVCAKAKVTDAHIHDLRHTFASQIINAGYSLEVVGELLGHTNLSTTRRYTHLQDRLKREVVDSIGKGLEQSTRPVLPA